MLNKVLLKKIQIIARLGWTLKNTARKARRLFVLEVLLEVQCLESFFTLCAFEKEILKRRISENG